MPTQKFAARTNLSWQLILLCLTLSALLAACAGAPGGLPPGTSTPERATTPTRAPEAVTSPADQDDLDQADLDQEILYNRWYTPVVASLYPFLICQSSVSALDGTEIGDTRAQAAALIAVRANAGREVLVNWDPPEEHQQIRTDALAYLNILIEVSRQWYREEIDGTAFRQQMDEVCTGTGSLLQDTAYLARQEGLTLESMQAISDRFEQAIANP